MTKRDAADAALSVAEDIAAGRLDPAAMEAEIADNCRELMGTVTGPDHPCWAVQLEVCRAVLAAGGLPAEEIAEWLSPASADGLALPRPRPAPESRSPSRLGAKRRCRMTSVSPARPATASSAPP